MQQQSRPCIGGPLLCPFTLLCVSTGNRDNVNMVNCIWTLGDTAPVHCEREEEREREMARCDTILNYHKSKEESE